MSCIGGYSIFWVGEVFFRSGSNLFLPKIVSGERFPIFGTQEGGCFHPSPMSIYGAMYAAWQCVCSYHELPARIKINGDESIVTR